MKKNKKEKKHIGYGFMFSSVSVLGIILTTGLVFFVMWSLSSDDTIILKEMNVLTIFLLTLAFSAIITFTLQSLFIKPLVKLTEAMNMVAKGDFSIQLKHDRKKGDLFEVYNSFNTMVKELAQTDTLQTDFISNVSHEFKTPINAIEGYASLLQDNRLSKEEQNAYVDKIIFNTRRLSELVGNVLLLSKITNQSIHPKETSYRLDEQIRQSILALEDKWEKKNIDFDIELDDIEYTGTENLLVHVWTNLIDNAVKFSPVGGEINIRLRKNRSTAHFTISNYGPSIPVECYEKIFTKFYQCDTSRKSEGNGLGLALVKRIIDESKGRITVSSQSDNKTTFEVILPLTCKDNIYSD